MAFNQYNLERVHDQSRGAFDLFVYYHDTDTIADVLADGYFDEGKFGFKSPGNNPKLINVKAADGDVSIRLIGDVASKVFSQADINNVVEYTENIAPANDVNRVVFYGKKDPFLGAGFIDEDNSLATITPESGGVGLTNEIRYFDDPTLFRHNGALQEFTSSGGLQLLQIDLDGGTTGGNTGQGFDSTSSEFTVKTDAQSIAFELLDNADFCVKVDGVFVSKTPVSFSSGGFQKLLVDFPSKKVREVTVCAPRAAAVFRGVFILPTDTIYKPAQSKKVAFITDSFGVGLTVDRAGQHWPDIISSGMGWDNYLVNGRSGTGFINKSAGNTYNFFERIPQVAAWNPELVVVNCSINDENETESDLTSAVTNFINTITVALPNARIVVVGAIGRNDSGSIFVETTVKNAIDAIGHDNVVFVPSQLQTSDGWVFGTGRVGTTTSDGNADIYINTDGTHFTASGQVYWAQRLMQGMLEAGVY